MPVPPASWYALQISSLTIVSFFSLSISSDTCFLSTASLASSRPLTFDSSAATWSISASICRLYSSSFASVPALMPIERVPLNIMCSWKCEMPVIPGRSFTEPTR